MAVIKSLVLCQILMKSAKRLQIKHKQFPLRPKNNPRQLKRLLPPVRCYPKWHKS